MSVFSEFFAYIVRRERDGKLFKTVFSNPGLNLNDHTHGLPRCSHLYPFVLPVKHGPSTEETSENLKDSTHPNFAKFCELSGNTDGITNNEVIIRADMKSLEAIITRHRLRWAGHLARMTDSRLPKQVLFSELDASSKTTTRCPQKTLQRPAQGCLEEDGNRPGQLGDGSCRKKSLEKDYS